MSVKREFLGETKDGAPIYGYHMTNSQGMEVCLMNYGATIRNIFVKDKEGQKRDVVLGYDDPEIGFDGKTCIMLGITRINKVTITEITGKKRF